MKSLLLLTVILNVLLAVVYGAESTIQKRGIFSRNHKSRDVRRRNQQIIPPIALPGIMNDYDPERVYHRGKRMFSSELNSLENRFPRMSDIFNGEKVMSLVRSSHGSKRSIVGGEQMIYVPQPMINRPKRDLRRLKRDLDYATGYGYPNYAISKRNRNSGQLSYPDYVSSPEDLESLLQGVDMLEYLALLKQAGELPSLGTEDNYNNVHSTPSRFAPQPRLFPEQLLRKENGRMLTNKHLPQGRIVWSPEKRSSVGRLSMVPGFKRSSFREAERMTPRSSNTNAELLKEVLSEEANGMKIRRVPM